MSAWSLFTQILKDPRKLEMALFCREPEELQEVFEIECTDTNLEVFWMIKDAELTLGL